MALPTAPGQISLSAIQAEFGGTEPISLVEYRAGAGLVAAGTKGYPGGIEIQIPSSGEIALSNFHGASASGPPQSLTITTDQQELNLRTWALANGWNGVSFAEITVATGVYIWSDDICKAGMAINGSWPGGVKLINNGYIMGKGGKGAGPTSDSVYFSPQSGGPAISLGVNATIVNNSYIAGGGGGGGSAGLSGGTSWSAGGGGGAGGGAGGDGYLLTATTWVSGPVGGAIGLAGGASASGDNTGGAGGRILPGTGGAEVQVLAFRPNGSPAFNRLPGKGGGSGGSGGGQASSGAYSNASVTSGAGGSAGAAGSAAHDATYGGTYGGTSLGAGGGGGWGASGGDGAGIATTNNVITSGAGAGGQAIALNGYTATLSGSGTIYGAVSGTAQSLTISSNQQELNLRTWALANGWNGLSLAEITIDTGVYIWSNSTSVAGLTIDGCWPNGVKLINKGYIMGKGGAGGIVTTIDTTAGAAGQNGGAAISLGIDCVIDNGAGYIAGGGGGGGSARKPATSVIITSFSGGGGGAGGGDGGTGCIGLTLTQGGSGGAIGSAGSAGTNSAGGGGGRQLPGTGGAATSSYTTTVTVAGSAGGAGGGGAVYIFLGTVYNSNCFNQGGGARVDNWSAGGGGGGWGAAGGTSYVTNDCINYTQPTSAIAGGAGGSAGSAGSDATFFTPVRNATALGGLGGSAVKLNGYAVTWTATGTRYGAIA